MIESHEDANYANAIESLQITAFKNISGNSLKFAFIRS